MKTPKISRAKKRLYLYILLGCIIAYIGYQMISFYTTEQKTSVSIEYGTSENNIVSKVTAEYTMMQGKGRLELIKDFSDCKALPEGCVSSFVEITSTDGKPITKAILTFEYDETYLNFNECDLIAVRLSDDMQSFYTAESTVDEQNNTVTVKTSGTGKWCLALKN